jgi:hypothetical protein
VERSGIGKRPEKVAKKPVSTRSYLRAAIALGLPQWPLLSVACSCLVVASAATLALPNYQGSVVGRVVAGDRAGFITDVKIFVGLSVVIGVFGSVRNVCFRVVGRRISCALRNRLFKAIVVSCAV